MADTSGQRHYANARTLLDLSLQDLLKVFPELQGIEPAGSQDQLFPILSKTGQEAEQFYRALPNVVATERVTQEELNQNDGRVRRTFQREFSYLILAHHDQSEATIEEYRADAQGKPIEPTGLAEALPFTEGFASMWVVFFPGNRSDSNFRYLGRQSLNGRDTHVVAFAQRPGWSSVAGRMNWEGRSIVLLYQGLAWVDVTNYRIMRMRLDLLAPRLDILLERQTLEIQFGEVHISGIAPTLWLAQQVTITTIWNGRTLRNRHLYSDYHFFAVQSTINPIGTGQKKPERLD